MNLWMSFLRKERMSIQQLTKLLQDIYPNQNIFSQEQQEIQRLFEESGIYVHMTDKDGFCSEANFDSKTLSVLSGSGVHFVNECSSTNTLARSLATEKSSSKEIDVVVSDFQTKGRGRLQRNWYSEPGKNLLFSLILRPNISPQLAPRCTLLWATAIATELDFYVKWPNDIFTEEGKKIGGLLCEAIFSQNTIEHLIVGVGINVHQQKFPVDTYASSLDIERNSSNNNRSLLLARLIRCIRGCDISQNMDQHRERSFVLGKEIQVGTVKGMAEAIHEDGTLIVDGQAICTGDVEILPEIQETISL